MIEAEPIVLTTDEIFGITGYRNRRCQRRWFNRNGVQFKERGNGSLVVSRRHFEHIMGGFLDIIGSTYVEPDFSTIQ